MEVLIISDNSEKLELAFKGKLDVLGADQIGARFYALLNPVEKPVVIDSQELEFLSSMGIRLLITALKMTRQAGYSLKLTHVNAEVKKVLQATELDELID